MSTNSRVYAPKVKAETLWRMGEKEFNDWRRENDYPRIIEFLKTRLPEFDLWMEEQKISDALLIAHSPSSFLNNQSLLYLYQILNDRDGHKEMLSEKKYAVNETFFHQNLVQARKDIVPYPLWYKKKNQKAPPTISVNGREGRSHFILSDLELLDLGNCHLSGMFPIGNRYLDFTNLSDLRISNCINNTWLNLWFCSATNLIIEGDLAFINAYNSQFYEVFNRQSTNLKLMNGSFQSWSFLNCEVNILASNALIQRWKFVGWDFNATINNSEIRDCEFLSSAIRYPIDLGRAQLFHAHVKRLYSQIGKKKKASEHYYWEKTYERKALLHLKENHRDVYIKAAQNPAKLILKARFLIKYIYSGFLNLLWGYGERPTRVFFISIAIILFFALVYCFTPSASATTRYDFVNSLYYSMVTFTTLGYGDISQSNKFLKLMSGFEALLGMTFWGILIAAFTSNAKDY